MLSQENTKLVYKLNHVIFWGLSLQTLWVLIRSLKLIFIQLPATEKKLLADTITQTDVSLLANDAIFIIINLILNTFLITWFFRSSTQQNRFIQTIIGVTALIGNSFLWIYLQNQNSSIFFQPLIDLVF